MYGNYTDIAIAGNYINALFTKSNDDSGVR